MWKKCGRFTTGRRQNVRRMGYRKLAVKGDGSHVEKKYIP